MVHQMAVFKRITHECSSTEASLSTTLFTNNNPFESFTVFLIEVSTTPIPYPHPKFTPIYKTLNLDIPVSDPELSCFVSSKMDDGMVVAGFVLYLQCQTQMHPLPHTHLLIIIKITTFYLNISISTPNLQKQE
ncbi:hypothetical protein Hdeb2414_s0009g00312691 [Helianthus debilis subsp. tardiflorus]